MRASFFCIAILFIGTSCRDSSSSGSPEAEALADAEVIQGLLPGLMASEAVAVPQSEARSPDEGSSSVAEAIGTWNAADLPPTPAEMFVAYDTGNGYARFPPEGSYIHDFYGTPSQLAHLELRQTSDGWGEYQASLYVYPTLSSSVWRGLERYRIDGDSWDDLVRGPQGQLFEELKTYFFDGLVEDRTLVFNRTWVDAAGSQIFETAYFDIPGSFSDPAFDHGDPIAAPAKVAIPLTDPSSYAAHTVGTITFPDSFSSRSGETVEFYHQVPNTASTGVLKNWKAFSRVTTENRLWTSRNSAVHFAFEDVDGTRAERSKTVTEYSLLGRWTYDSTETQITDIGEFDDGRKFYDSETSVYYNDSGNPTTVVELYLSETSVGSDEYTGAMVYTRRGMVRDRYTATLDAQNGLTIKSTQSATEASFPVNRVSHLGDILSERPKVRIDFLENGGSFSGTLSGGTLSGDYVDRRGQNRKMSVSPAGIVLDGKLADPPAP